MGLGLVVQIGHGKVGARLAKMFGCPPGEALGICDADDQSLPASQV